MIIKHLFNKRSLGIFSFVVVFLSLLVFFSLMLQTPNVQSLREEIYYSPLKMYDAQGEFLVEYGRKKQKPVDYDEVPEIVIKSFLAAEDSRFFEHFGVDVKSLFRAILEVFIPSGHQTGASTITMQLARGQFLSRDRTIVRKVKEIFLALKIESVFSKEEILTFYLNSIFLGYNSYGVGAAAEYYYRKSLFELTTAEAAMLAVLPKAPSRINPLAQSDRALERRNWILGRMRDLDYIDQLEYDLSVQSLLSAKHSAVDSSGRRDVYYPVEWIRIHLLEESQHYFGEEVDEDILYRKGYRIYTTIDSHLQSVATDALSRHILRHEMREGYYQPMRLETIKGLSDEAIIEALHAQLPDKEKSIAHVHQMHPVVVLSVNAKGAEVLFETGERQKLPLSAFELIDRIRYYNEEEMLVADTEFSKPFDLIKKADIVYLLKDIKGIWRLTQMPKLQGALISIDPRTGKIYALSGGFDFFESKFNRATQAKRQIGSTMKPFLYSAALESDLTAATLINDAPFLENETSNDIWRPFNDGGRFLGFITLRKGLVWSKNLVSVRIIDQIGLKTVLGYFKKWLLPESTMVKDYSVALGSSTMTPLELARGYMMFANGGYVIDPFLVERIETKEGEVIFQKDIQTACIECYEQEKHHLVQDSTTNAPLLSSSTHFIMNSILQQNMKRGIGWRSNVLRRQDLSGKTGTTNGNRDVWFAGYTRDVVTVSWMGYDNFNSMNSNSYGANIALPLWIDFMREAIKPFSEDYFLMPEDVMYIKIDPKSFKRVANDQEGIWEYFKIGTEPQKFSTTAKKVMPPEPKKEKVMPPEPKKEKDKIEDKDKAEKDKIKLPQDKSYEIDNSEQIFN